MSDTLSEPDAGPSLDYRGALADLVAEFKRVFPIYYYAEPWVHEKNAVLLNAQLLLACAAPIAQQAEPAQARQPLTDQAIEAGRQQVFSTGNPFCPCDSKTMRKAVRWAEAAHGITAAKKEE
jgi:hypothetical protein